MRILLTGSSGFVGQHLLPYLRGRGHQVLTLARGSQTAAGPFAWEGPADLADIERWPSWPEHIEALVHLAALNPGRGDPQAFDLEALRHANVGATAALTRRARREGVRRVVFVSTALVHRPSHEGFVSQSDRPVPANAYARSKLEAEEIFWTSLKGGDTEGSVLRPAPVYGSGARGNITKLIRLARLPLPLPLEGLGSARSLLAVNHLAEALELCLGSPAAIGETFLVADDGPVTPAEIVRAIRQGLGRSPMIFRAPATLFAAIARWAGRNDQWQNATMPFALETRHIQDRLGWQPSGTTKTMLRRMAAAGTL
ncbi:MAG TPA: NAD-dependent epimerase/dehydratase family protein [Aurantimonas coralicida]|uniref:NAD-dependent epimerase/dehydratase family protein n=1 Tax=Aurantimonas coralicida TaxID=182270 RepID=A0A9C9TGZ0_9HYPH|nr:NAD-dependent epimerase/dehydratase family protein [Aurantimonas coralicida]HEU00960.1 NAD-dependent epimerase/dehydratase family protein [Aurantimonas coralicida]